MSMKKGTRQTFRVMVRHVDLCVNAFEMHQIAVNPFTNRKVFNVHVACGSSGLLSISHHCARAVVLIEDSSYFLWYSQVPHDASDE